MGQKGSLEKTWVAMEMKLWELYKHCGWRSCSNNGKVNIVGWWKWWVTWRIS